MKYNERFVVFECQGDQCIGVLAAPGHTLDDASIGVVIVVGGPQYRVGSHRQFVSLARHLASNGIPVLRFDFRGMGDSEGSTRTFEDIRDDLRAAVDTLVQQSGVDRVIFWGLCDGASASLMFAAEDERIAGLVIANPWARTPQLEAATKLKHYYRERILSPDFWRKVVRGRFRFKARVAELLGSISIAAAGSSPEPISFLHRMEAGWSGCRLPILVLLSGRDLTAREFEGWVAADAARMRRSRGALCEVVKIGNADHTFSTQETREFVGITTLTWINRLSGSIPNNSPPAG